MFLNLYFIVLYAVVKLKVMHDSTRSIKTFQKAFVITPCGDRAAKDVQ